MAHEYHKYVLEDREDVAITHSPPLCGSGNGPEEARSLINFKASGYNNLINSGESLLGSQHSRLVSNSTCLHQNYNQWNQIGPRSTTDPRVMQYFNCVQPSSGHSEFEKPHSESPSMGVSVQAAKKQRTSASKTPKPKSSPSSKDPQSVAAKNRRERISERLKILQELVPNGSKVDLVTMLEKAIAYVKFLQLQAKVLATDEFWPVQGEKAPDISQVKEAIDDILSSQRDRNSISK